jgi:hypothetical protein
MLLVILSTALLIFLRTLFRLAETAEGGLDLFPNLDLILIYGFATQTTHTTVTGRASMADHQDSSVQPLPKNTYSASSNTHLSSLP